MHQTMNTLPHVVALVLTVLHWLLLYILNVHVYFTDNIGMLNTIVVIDMIVALQWYVLGGCILTPIENQLATSSDRHVPLAEDNHFMVTGLARWTGIPVAAIKFGLSMMPLLSTCVALWRMQALRCRAS